MSKEKNVHVERIQAGSVDINIRVRTGGAPDMDAEAAPDEPVGRMAKAAPDESVGRLAKAAPDESVGRLAKAAPDASANRTAAGKVTINIRID